jgi:hypothetical protein
MSFEYSKVSLNATILQIANILLIDLPWYIPAGRSFSCGSFLSVQCSPHSHSPWSIVSYSTSKLAKGVLNNIYPLQMGPSASMVGRQPRHHHQKDPFVHRGSHPCLDRNRRYYRIALTAHLAVIPYFLPICQQSSSCSSVNVRRVDSGQSSLVLKQSSRDQTLICQYIGPFISLDTHMRWNPSPLRYLRDLLVRNSMSFVRYYIPVDLSS